jgi:hypothetical protein
MDPINLVYYAAICAGLSALSPRVPTLPWRLGIGALVGLIAATFLPFVKSLGGY